MSTMQSPRKGSGAGAGAIFVLIGLAIFGLMFTFGNKWGTMNYMVALISACFSLLLGAIIIIITRLYMKTGANEAYIRTGMGGRKVVIDGGGIVVGVVHQLLWVSTETMRLDVERVGAEALITGDNLRADVKSEFYIRVQKDAESIDQAATSLGDKAVNAESISSLVSFKLISALRQVAATKSLSDLNTKRDEFATAVKTVLLQPLKENGLTLEDVTISRLDQTPPDTMRGESNIFDAQGLATIAKIVQEQRVAKNNLEMEGDKKVKEQQVERDQFLFLQDTIRATKEAERDSNIRVAKANQDQNAKTAEAEQSRIAREAAIVSDKAVELKDIEKTQSIQVANQLREQANEVAEQERQKAVEVAERDKQIAVTDKARQLAEAAEKQNKAEAAAEKEKQNIATVQVTETARRTAEQEYISRAREIDKNAYEKTATANAEKDALIAKSEGEKQSAENQAVAVRTKAEADRDAKVAEATGAEAVAMVPVNVSREQVAVDQKRVVEVTIPELQAKNEFQEAAIQLELGKLRIEADKAIGIEQAKAMGQALSSAEMQIFGDPQTVSTMWDRFTKGMATAKEAEGLIRNMDPKTRETLTALFKGVKDTIVSGLGSIFGKTLKPEQLDELAEKIANNPDIVSELKNRLASLTGTDVEKSNLAAELMKKLGLPGLDVKAVTKLVDRLIESPDVLDQLTSVLENLKPRS